MKRILFFLLLTEMSFAQTDSSSAKIDSSKMKSKEVVIDEVVVNGTRANANSPTPFQVLTKEELNKNNLGQDLPYLIENTPSVVTTSDAGTGIGYTQIHIRGSDATRVNVTLNGVPVNDGESQGVYWVDIPDVVSSTQNIQIQRGIGTSTNGPGAFGGTVSLQTQTPNPTPFGEVNMSGGSFHTLKMNAKAGTGLIKNKFFIEGSGSWISSDGYVDRAYSRLSSWFFQAGYLHNNTLLKLVYFGGREKTYQSWDGVLQDSLKTNRRYNDLGTDFGQHYPPYPNQTDNYGQDYFQLIFAQQLPKHLYLSANLFATLGRGYYEEYKANQDFNSYFPGFDTVAAFTDLVRQKWLKNIYYGGTFALNYEYKSVSATFGGLLSQYRGENFGKVIWALNFTNFDFTKYYYDGHSVKNDYTVYVKFNYDLLNKVNFYADLQYRYVSYHPYGVDDNLAPFDVKFNWHFFNPKVGIIYKMKYRDQLYASFALGNREPNRDDVLAANASGTTIKPEIMRDLEVGYKFMHPKVPVFVNFYLMHYKDQLVLTGRLNDVGAPIKANVPVSYRAGLEIYGTLNFFANRKQPLSKFEKPEEKPVWKFCSVNYAFTYSINKINSFDEYIYTYDVNYVPIDTLTLVVHHKNTDISYSPNIVASLELTFYPIKGLSLSMLNKAVSSQYLDNTGDINRILKSYYYANINIAYSVPLPVKNKEIKIKLLLNNIFNHLYESNGYSYSERYYDGTTVSNISTYNYYYPQAGFNLLAGVSVRF